MRARRLFVVSGWTKQMAGARLPGCQETPHASMTWIGWWGTQPQGLISARLRARHPCFIRAELHHICQAETDRVS